MPIPNEHLNQFKPGQSGNPKGRPKGVRNLSTILREMLEQEVPITTEDGKVERKKLQEILVRKLINQAVKKENLKAIQEIFDRVEGKPVQRVEMNTISPEDVANLFPFGNPEDNHQQYAEGAGDSIKENSDDTGKPQPDSTS